MATATTLQTLINTERKLVIKRTVVYSGTVSTADGGGTLIDVSDYTSIDGKACSYITIDKLWSYAGPTALDLLWASNNNYPVISVGGTSTAVSPGIHYDFSAWGGLVPPTLGSTTNTSSADSAGSGTPTGDLLVEVRSATAGERTVIVIEGTKHYA